MMYIIFRMNSFITELLDTQDVMLGVLAGILINMALVLGAVELCTSQVKGEAGCGST